MAALFIRRVALSTVVSCVAIVSLGATAHAGAVGGDTPSFPLQESLPVGLSQWVPTAVVALLVLLVVALLLLTRRPDSKRRERPSPRKTATVETAAVDQRAPEASISSPAEAADHTDPNLATDESSGLPEATQSGAPEPPPDLAPQPVEVAAATSTASPAVDGNAGKDAPAVDVPSIPFDNRTELAISLLKMGQEAALEGDRERAHGLTRQALEVDSLNVDAWVWRGATAGSEEESLVCLRTALILDPENEKAKRGLASLLSQSLEGTAER